MEKKEKKSEGYLRDNCPEREEEIKKDIHKFVNYMYNENTDCTDCGPIEWKCERKINRIIDFILPLIQGICYIIAIMFALVLVIRLFNSLN